MKRYSTLQKLNLICLITTAVPTANALVAAVNAAHMVGLLPRQEGSGSIPSLTQCGAGMPEEFSCPSETTCLSLSNATTVICCPKGQTCEIIQPITCDITQQNAKDHPNNPVHTTNFTQNLPQCADGCCPGGYNCISGQCFLDKAALTPAKPSSATSSTTPSATPSAIQTASATSIATSSPAASTTPAVNATLPAEKVDKFPAGAVMAGFFPGIILGLLIFAGVLFFLRRRRQRNHSPISPDFGDVNRKVSDPIYNPDYGHRTDFLRSAGSGSARDSYRPFTANSTYIGQVAPGTAVTAGSATPASQINRPKSRLALPLKINTTGLSSTPARYPQPPQMSQQRTGSTLSIGIGRPASVIHRDPLGRSQVANIQVNSKGSPMPVRRSLSSETIEVAMPKSFLGSSLLGGERERRDTTFTTLMADAGYSREERMRMNQVQAQGNGKGLRRVGNLI